MITISLCMIVKNEEEVLKRCLDSAAPLTDEIIIVDTGSTDRTIEIARSYTPLVYSFPWTDDFSAARNYSFSKASMDYCLWLDADDVISSHDLSAFLRLKQTLSSDTDTVMMRYCTAFDEYGAPSFWYYRERLIKNNRTAPWKGFVHEAIPPSGKTVYSDISVFHQKIGPGNPDRNLHIYEKLLSKGKELDCREHYYYARELYYHKEYHKAIQNFEYFLSLPDAWLENKIEACLLLAECYRQIGCSEKELEILLKTLEYDLPRAEVCCEIGNRFLEKTQYQIAIFWFETALHCQADFTRGGFILPDCYDYIPALQLCVCYDRIGRYQEAQSYNEMAGKAKPYSQAFLQNKTYFKNKLSQNSSAT